MNKGKTLYLECKSGISGDMTVAALLDLGADAEGLKKTLAAMHVGGYDISISNKTNNGMAGCDFDVILHEPEPHDHAHPGHDDGHASGHHAHGEPRHTHEHHHHAHRNLHDVLHIIGHAPLSPRAAHIARRAFEIVAEAEANAHGIPIGEVHFHEVGAIDSIVDIVSAAFCLDDLGVERVIVPLLYEGSGTITCQHGVLPVPVPAVVNIAAQHGIALKITDVDTEMVTPTGAAIVAAVRTDEALPGTFRILKTGIGLGKRDLGRPNFLRAMLIEAEAAHAPRETSGAHTILESNIDDSTGEELALAMERLLDAGALDAHYIPCFMKKNRPAYLLRVICKTEQAEKLEDVIFRSTTTIGIRRTPFERTALPREEMRVMLPAGEARVKKCTWQEETFYYPEFESIRTLCERSGRPFAELFAEAKVEAKRADR